MLLVELCAKYCTENPLVKSQETERLLFSAVKQYSIFLKRDATTNDFTPQQFTAFLRYRRKIGRAESTIEREASKLMTLWRWAASEGLCQLPRIRVQKAEVDTPICFLRHELRRLFRQAKRYERTVGGISGNIFMSALLATIWDTAERIGAIREVERSDIDISFKLWPRCGWIAIRKRKRSGKTLTRPLRRSTVRLLRRLLAETGEQQPFKIVDRTTLYGHLNTLLDRAGLPQDRKHKFHCVRRSHASYLFRAGGDPQSSLDHEDANTTRLRYLDPRVTHRKHFISYLFDPLSWYDRLLAWIGW